MGDDIFQKLRSGAPPATQQRPPSPYSFQGSSSPQTTLRDRPGVVAAPSRPTVVEPARGPTIIRTERSAEGDRPEAYPPAVRRREDEGDLYEWKPPTFGDILADLGLRILEVGVAAAAYAIGEEVAYFFKKRRFTHKGSRER